MIKSELEIEQDVYNLLKNELKGIIGGKVYKSGCRPMDAKTEDAVISVSDATADQIQLGHVLINIYVPDIKGMPNKSRLMELCKKHEAICELMNSLKADEYSFKPGRAASAIEEPDIKQHFANLNIEFERITFN